MRTISLRIPDSLYRQARALTAREGITFNQLVALALAARVHAELTEEERETRAAKSVADGLDSAASTDDDHRDLMSPP